MNCIDCGQPVCSLIQRNILLCKTCRKKRKLISNNKAQKKWYRENTQQSIQSNMDCTNTKPFRDAEKFISNYHGYHPIKELKSRIN
jgi:hypothetical protein